MSDRHQSDPFQDPAAGPVIGALTDEIERLRRLVDCSIDLYLVHDGDGAILDVSAAARRLLGGSRRELVGSSIDTHVHDDDVVAVREARRQLLAGAEAVPIRFRFRAADGTHRWVEQLAASVADTEVLGLGVVPSRRRREITLVLRDLDGQDGSDAEARRADERLSGAFRSAAVGAALCDPSGTITQVDGGFAELMGLTVVDLLGCSLDSLLAPGPTSDHRDRPGPVLAPAVAAMSVERALRQPDGSARAAELNVRAVGDGDDAIVSYVVLVRDLSERDDIQSFQGAVARPHRSELLGRVTTGAAQQWAQRMDSLRSDVDAALDDALLAPPTRRRLETIAHGLDAAAASARELQQFAGRRAAVSHQVDLGALVERTIHFVQQASEAQVEFMVERDGEGCVVSADPRELESVLLALVLNAAAACSSVGIDRPGTGLVNGTVVVEVRARSSGTAAVDVADLPHGIADWVLLRVTDDGAGMSEQVRRQAFEPFFSTRADGSGLGLAVVDRVVRDAGGVVRLRSTLGHGTTVEVWLPASSAAATTAADEPPPARLDIVVVDDQPEVLDLASRVLERAGHSVRRADGAAVALRLIGDGPLDVLVSDLVMPGMSGQELVAQLRDSRPDLGVVVITGYAGDSDQVLPDDIELVPKPFRSAELVDAVRRAAPPMAAVSA